MSAMPRIDLIEADQHPELAALIDAVKAQRGGKFLHLYAALAHSPALCAGWLALFTAIRQQSSLAPDLRELAMLRVAVLNRAPYEFRAHAPFAREAGVSDAQLDALHNLELEASMFSALQMAVLEYTDEMTRHVQVSDPCFDAVRRSFDAATLVELTVTIAGYNMVSRVLEALNIPHESEH